ncbi:SPOR domain-containing protein [Thalassospira povalilytica]|uniref:SPOR domain-containing protein n=1 Tax=Thalassospira povalilytica TaxID=732237 RepID=A0ABX4R513_9PROT|nr:SPOR domain-containing protein [Thalassospira povalilytica]PKR48119.1 hypothetical protein CU041_15440 [Thalassospira povalilytica]
MAKFMVGEDQTNKPDLRATPQPDSEPESGQKDAPLPAFIYGRDGHGDGNGRDGRRTGDRQNFNARIADMDRKTLLGLVTGAGMLGLVLFFAGMLVGAGLFMDSDDGATNAALEKPPVEMLATEPDEPAVVSEPVPQSPTTTPETVAEIAESSDDPVGDLIAQRSAALENSDEAASDGDAAATTSGADDAGGMASELTANDTAGEGGVFSAPEIREVGEAPAAPDAPEAPAVESSAATAQGTNGQAAGENSASSEPAKADAAPDAPAAPAKQETAARTSATQNDEAEVATNGETPFSVQVGAFKVHENASQRAEELRKKGLEVAVVVRGAADDSAWYYVRIGKYATLKQARDDAAKIKKDHALDGFPVRAEPNDREVD